MSNAVLKVGKVPPRSLYAFGIAGLLSETAEVFSGQVFNTRNVGRVADLAAAKLRQMVGTFSLAEEARFLDELKLRILILNSVFEGFESQQAMLPSAPGETSLVEPVGFEIGLDEEKVAVGVSFAVVPKLSGPLEGLGNRVFGLTPDSQVALEVFERFAKDCIRASEQAIYRVRPSESRAELVLLMSLGRHDAEAVGVAATTEVEKLTVIDLDSQPLEEAAQPANYAEMGELDFAELLKEVGPGKPIPPPLTGEFLVQQTGETLEEIRLRGDNLKSVIEETRIKGGADQLGDGEMQKISGGPSGGGPLEKFIFKGSGKQADDGKGGYRVIGGGSGGASQELVTIGDYQARVAELERQVASAAAAPEKGVGGFFKKMWPFKAAEPQPEPQDLGIPEPQPPGVEATDDLAEEEGVQAVAPAKKAKKVAKVTSDPTQENEGQDDDLTTGEEGAPSDAGTLEASMGTKKKGSDDPPTEKKEGSSSGGEGGDSAESELEEVVKVDEGERSKVMKDLELDAEEMKKELASSPKGQKLVDNMMAQLVQERSKLSELTKKVTQAARVRELDFKTKEQALTQALKRKEDELKQRESAVTHLKEQLSRATSQFQTLKTQSTKQAQDDAGYKQKYTLTQKLLLTSKEEIQELTKKVAELKEQAGNQGTGKTRGPSVAELADMKGKYERAFKMAEDLKRSNTSLHEQLAEAKKQAAAGTGGGGEDLKRKLDASARAAVNAKREAEQAQAKLQAMQKEELRLKGEVNRLNAELRAAKQNEKREKTTGGGAPAQSPASASQVAAPGSAAPPTGPSQPSAGTGTESGPQAPQAGGTDPAGAKKPAGGLSAAARRRLAAAKGGSGTGGGNAPPAGGSTPPKAA